MVGPSSSIDLIREFVERAAGWKQYDEHHQVRLSRSRGRIGRAGLAESLFGDGAQTTGYHLWKAMSGEQTPEAQSHDYERFPRFQDRSQSLVRRCAATFGVATLVRPR